MTRIRTVVWAAVAGLSLAAAGAWAAGNPVADRQAAMKQVAAAMKDGSGYVSGQTAWDAAKVKTVMTGLSASSKKAHGLFTAGSDKDPKTAADPKIWTNRADFDKRMNEMAALATAASKASSADDFKPKFLALGATCKGCHDLYRKKKT